VLPACPARGSEGRPRARPRRGEPRPPPGRPWASRVLPESPGVSFPTAPPPPPRPGLVPGFRDAFITLSEVHGRCYLEQLRNKGEQQETVL